MKCLRIWNFLIIAACCLAHTLPVRQFDQPLTHSPSCDCHRGMDKRASISRRQHWYPMMSSPPLFVRPLALRGGGTHDGGRKKMKKKKMMEDARNKRFEDEAKVSDRIKKAKRKAKQLKREQRCATNQHPCMCSPSLPMNAVFMCHIFVCIVCMLAHCLF